MWIFQKKLKLKIKLKIKLKNLSLKNYDKRYKTKKSITKELRKIIYVNFKNIRTSIEIIFLFIF